MALSSPATAVAPFDSGRLAAGISATATTITVSPIYKTVNGVRTKQGFDTTSGLAIITQGDFTERISFEGSSVNATTKITSLTTCTRGLSATSTTASFTGGTGRAWPKGAKITVVADASYFQSGVYKNVANTFTSAQTFNAQVNVAAPLLVSGATSYVKLPELTQGEEDALTPAEGMMIKNSTTGTIRQYTGGAWASVGTDATANAANTTAGKVDVATVAEIAAGTDTDATSGGQNALVVANTVVTSADGAWASGNIPALNTSKFLDGSLGGTGLASPATGALLIGGGAGAAMTAIGPGTSGQVPVSNGTTIAMGTHVPVGGMMIWTTDTAPTGWILCYGQAVSRTTYATLFTAISTAFGVGDGSATFNLPDMRGRFPLGQDDMGGSSADRVTATEADAIAGVNGAETSAHTHTVAQAYGSPGGGAQLNGVSATGSTSPNVMNPYLTVNYIIYAAA